MFRRLKRAVAAFAADENEDEAKRKSKPRQRRQFHDAKFIRQINNTLRANANVAAGRVHMVGVENIKEHFKDRWSELADRVNDIACAAIARRVGANDVFTQYDDLKFLVVFADISPEQAQLKCALIAKEISRRIFGNNPPPDFTTVDAVSVKKNGQLRFKTAHNLDSFVSELEAAEAKQSGQKLAKWNWVSAVDEKKEHEATLKHIAFLYRPIWQQQRGIISTYLCLPVQTLDNSEIITGYNILEPGSESFMYAKLDMAVLSRAQRDIYWFNSKEQPQVITVPVHFETLATQIERAQYIRQCHELDEALWPYLSIEIVGIPIGAPSGRVREIVSFVQPFCRAVMVRLRLGDENFKKYAGGAVHAVGLDVDIAVVTETKLLAHFNDFCAEAEEARLRPYVHGLGSRSLLIGAIAAGFYYVDGAPISGLEEEPKGIIEFELEQIYQEDMTN